MSTKFEESKTAQNLARAFAGECQDGARYQWVADMAQKEGYKAMATILKQIATNEMAHAKAYMDLLVRNASGVIESIKIEADYPMQFGTLLEMLEYEEKNERKQALEVYVEFARIAETEGFEDAKDLFMRVAQVETCHTNQLHQIATKMKNKELYKSKEEKRFKCSNCGHEANLKSAWKTCPLCGKPQGFAIIEITQEAVVPPEDTWKALDASQKAKQAKDNRPNSFQNPKQKIATKK